MKTKSILVIIVFTVFTNAISFAQMRLLSGPDQGAYYAFAEDIISVTTDSANVPIMNYKTDGAAYNFEVLVAPLSDYKVAFMQMDYLYFMQARDAQNNTEKTKHLKVLLPMAKEEIHIISKESTGLKKLSDLGANKKVGIGSQEQATYSTAFYINDKTQLNWSARNYPFGKSLQHLMLGELDAFFFVGTSPVKKFNVMPQGFKDELTLLTVDNFKGWAKNYEPSVIKAGEYQWLENDVPTFAVQTVLLVNEEKLTDDDKVLLKELVAKLKANKANLATEGHPKWAEIDFEAWDESKWPMLKLE